MFLVIKITIPNVIYIKCTKCTRRVFNKGAFFRITVFLFKYRKLLFGIIYQIDLWTLEFKPPPPSHGTIKFINFVFLFKKKLYSYQLWECLFFQHSGPRILGQIIVVWWTGFGSPQLRSCLRIKWCTGQASYNTNKLTSKNICIE